MLESDEQVDLTRAIRDYLQTPETKNLFSDLKDAAEDDTKVISPHHLLLELVLGVGSYVLGFFEGCKLPDL